MSLLINLLIAGAVVAIIVKMTHRPARFVVAIRNGTVEVRKGRVPGAFLADCELLCRENGLASGTIRGVEKDGRVELRFSGDIPARHHQRFRNVYAMHA